MARTVTIPVTFDIKNSLSDLQQLQQVMNQITFPKNLADKLQKDIATAMASLGKIKDLQDKKIVNTKDLSEAKRLTSAVEKIINSIGSSIGNADMSKLIPVGMEAQYKQLESSVRKLTLDLDAAYENQLNMTKAIVSSNTAMKQFLSTKGVKSTDEIKDTQQIIDLAGKEIGLLQKKKDLMIAANNAQAALNTTTRTTLQASHDAFMNDATKSRGGGKAFVNAAAGRAELQQMVTAISADFWTMLSAQLPKNFSLPQFRTAFEELTRVGTTLFDNFQMDPVLQQKLQDLIPVFNQINGVITQTKPNIDKLGNAFTVASQDFTVFLNNMVAKNQITANQMNQILGIVRQDVVAIGNEVKKGEAQIDFNQNIENTTMGLQSKIKQLLGFGAILTQVSRMIRHAITQIKELDAAMTQISVVTNFTNAQLWSQINSYMALAQQYGVTTTGVYQVSQLYYQQGLSTTEVLKMTTETLKMAKIANLDYAAATDYMTVAIRGFKLDVDDAVRVVDVYSKLAAIAATDTRELAIAMSKTSSIAESAGMSIESTSTFLTQMIEVTREAPENLGTAMKTIIARFQEMKKSPLELVEVEGEQVSLNKVDKALQTVGIRLTDASGQFRNLDDVIFELSAKWDSLDRNTQRYIATTVAGSRQQSRFLALMSDNQRLTELYAESLDSEDAALLQYAKTLDSIESKLNQVSTAFQQFYMSILNGPIIGGAIDFFKGILSTLNQIPKQIGVPAIVGTILGLKGAFSGFIKIFDTTMTSGAASVKKLSEIIKTSLTKAFTTGGNAAVSFGAKASIALNWIFLIAAAITAAFAIFDAINETAKEAGERAEEAKIKAAQAKKDYKDLISYEEQLNKASAEKDSSLEARQKWLDLNNEIAASYPALIARFDEENNAIVELGETYKDLTDLQRIAAKDAASVATQKSINADVKKINEISPGIADTRDSVKDIERQYNILQEQAQARVADPKNVGQIITTIFTKYNVKFDEVLLGGWDNYEDILTKNDEDFNKLLLKTTNSFMEANQAVSRMSQAIDSFAQGIVNFETYDNALPETFKNKSALSKSFSDNAKKEMAKNYNIQKGLELDTPIEDKDLYNYISENLSTFQGYVEASYKSFVKNFEGADDLIKEVLSEPEENLSVSEVSAALGKTKDSIMIAFLQSIQDNLNKNIDNIKAKLLKSGYGSTPSKAAGIPEMLSAELIANLESMDAAVADKISTHAKAIADANGKDSPTALAWQRAMTDVKDNDLLTVMANAEDPTSWFGAQGLANQTRKLKKKDPIEAQKIYDFANAATIRVADIANTMDEYVNALDNIDKAWKKDGLFSLNEILDLTQTGQFNATDFDGLKFKGSAENFRTRMLPERYNELRAKADTLTDDERIEYDAWAPIIEAYQAQLKLDADKIFSDSIRSVFENPENILKNIKNNKIFDQGLAEVISAILGKSQQGNELDGFTISGVEDTRQATIDIANKEFGINLYDYNQYVKESYNGLQDLDALEKEILQAQKGRYGFGLEKEAALTKMYAARNQLIMDPKSYDFMGSSYKDDLEPMYTLIENEQKALEVLKSGGKEGKINTKELRKMLAWTKGSDNASLKELREQSTALNSELDTKINEEQIAQLEAEIRVADKKAVDKYNSEVIQNNAFNKHLDAISDKPLLDAEGKIIRYLGQDIKTFGQLEETLSRTADPDLVRRALAIAADLNQSGMDYGEAIKRGLESVGLIENPYLINIEANVAKIAAAVELREKEAAAAALSGNIIDAIKPDISKINPPPQDTSQNKGFIPSGSINTPSDGLTQFKEKLTEGLQNTFKVLFPPPPLPPPPSIPSPPAVASIDASISLAESAAAQASKTAEDVKGIEIQAITSQTNISEAAQEAAGYSLQTAQASALAATIADAAVQKLNATKELLDSLTPEKPEIPEQKYDAMSSATSNPEVDKKVLFGIGALGIGALAGTLISFGTTLGQGLATAAAGAFALNFIPDKPNQEEVDAFVSDFENREVKMPVELNTDQANTDKLTLQEKIINSETKLPVGSNTNPAEIGINSLRRTEESNPIIIPITYGPSPGSGPSYGGGGFMKNQRMATGGVAAGGKTLVGELGPELRVSDGQYNVVGEQGAEFVNLKRNDIIFNHLQTASILKNGKGGRGRALVNGTGPAMAWSDYNMETISYLPDTYKATKKSGGKSPTEEEQKAAEIYTIELEKWFNWLQRIEQVDNRINLLQAKRANITDGREYASSLAQENAYLQAQSGITQDLIDHQKVERKTLQDKMKGMGDYFSFYGDSLTLNNKSIEDSTVGNEELGAEIERLISEYTDVNSAISENTITVEDNATKIAENLKDLRDKTIEVENEVLDALQNMYQKEIDGKQKVIDEKIKANDEYLKALKNSLDDERKMYEDNNKVEEKQKLQRKLSLLQRDTSGRNATEIRSLQQQLRGMSQDEYFQKREEAITALEEGLAMETDTMQNEVELLKEANQMKLDNMELYWAEVQEIINQGTTATLGFLTSWSQAYADASKTQQDDYLAQWQLTVDAAWEYSGTLNTINQTLVAAAQAQAATISSFADLQVASYQRIAQAAADSKTAQEASTAAAAGAAAGNVGKTNPPPPPPPPPTFTGYSYISKNSTQHDQYENFSNGTKTYAATESHSFSGRVCVSCGYTKFDKKTSSKVTYTATTAPKKVTRMAYYRGGLADYTGPAWLDGTKTKPEAVLNAEETKIYMSFAKAVQKLSTPNIATTQPFIGNTTAANGVDNMTINIEVQSGIVNNSTQANQLADTIFEKFTKMASKSGSIKVFRT